MEEIKEVAAALIQSGTHGLQAEVMLSAMKALKDNPELTIPEALACGLIEWDI